jgi:hypothetical protein
MRRPALAIIWYACALHYTWAILLILSPDAQHSTPVHAIAGVTGGRWGAVGSCFLVAALATAAPLSRSLRLLPWLLVPQLLLLIVSASGALYAVFAGHYADGVPRPWEFILGDQLPVILAASLYAAALVGYHMLGRQR